MVEDTRGLNRSRAEQFVVAGRRLALVRRGPIGRHGVGIAAAFGALLRHGRPFGGQLLLFAQLAAAGFSGVRRSEEHTSELQSLMRISYAVFCLQQKTKKK